MYRFSRAMKPLASNGSRALHMSTRLPLKQHKNVAAFHTMSTHLAAAKAPVEPNDIFMQGNSAAYIEEMYEAWLKDPSSVHLSWQIYFKNMANGISPGQAYQPPPTIVPSASARLPSLPGAQMATGSSSEVIDHMKIQLLVRAYQVRGHHIANLDPLGIQHVDLQSSTPKELELSYYGFNEKDLDRKFTLGPGILPAFIDGSKEMTLREIVDSLKKIYCGSIGIEYIHIPDRAQCDWIRQRVETPQPYKYTKEEKEMILDRLVWSDSFERFVSTKYPSEKRFGLEGGESLIPGMKALIDRSVDLGVESIVIGMPHRGRLNVLSNVVRKPNESIFCEFSGSIEPSAEGSGDVKYHLGMNYVRPTPSGKRVHLSLVANPSHLEAVNPVVLGKTRALQFYSKDENRDHSMAILMHGDAAFAGQGVVYETMGFHDLPAYTTGGTVHIVVNNQIGFTTDPRFSRSTPYCTDIAKSINAPVFHVNGDDTEAVTFVMKLAADWRQTFKRDVVIDLVCYRKHGHNETDQPSFTQPRMYEKIAKQKPVLEKYTEQLKEEGSVSVQEIEANKKRVWEILEESYAKSKDYKPTSREWLSSSWPGFKSPKELAEEILPHYPTGVSTETLQQVGKAISTVPHGFNIHRNLNRIIQQRAKNLNEGKDIDWATAEALAWGSLLLEGKHVRLSGQDVERGTFSQRHAILHDQKNETPYTLLANISPEQAAFTISNSSLSEYGVLGFELGYSLVDPNSLVMWEAQFGDFANTAQCIIDQFIASGEKKWLQRTGLVVLLPHGYDGQGPEHSSSRIERYLQMCDDHPYVYPSPEKLNRMHQDCNMQVIYASTPANYFHAMRRQIHREFRKPLIMPVSKAMLRHPLARSTLTDMTGNTSFQLYIPEAHPDHLEAPEKITKHILCSGQVYYALLRAREQNKLNNIAISRVEQLNPFPYEQVKEHADKYPNAEVIWCQEEPLNMGAWSHVQPRITTALSKSEHHSGKSPSYAGREPSASVATGNKKQHLHEEYSLLSKALLGAAEKPKDVQSGVPVWV
ncbi:oxoglutarate dehydrogenase, E1 component [Umbelopsis sp. PMI_123]|nr:oxoglutarate dehydrogenase, E1 component [Umbelopsis sp. PMI_123]